jgi:hypothetical protein
MVVETMLTSSKLTTTDPLKCVNRMQMLPFRSIFLVGSEG